MQLSVAWEMTESVNQSNQNYQIPFQGKGKLVSYSLESERLKSNFLGDPHVRDLIIYLPPEYSEKNHYSLLIDLAPYTNSSFGRVNWRNFGPNVPQIIDQMIVQEKMPPAVVAFPDCYTRLGGNQFVNSRVMGPYEDYLTHEVVPFIEHRFACGGSGKRGVYGKSSGGYGALLLGMKYPDFWNAIACQSGDMAFELVYLQSMPIVLNELAKHDYSIEKFITKFESSRKVSGNQINTLMILAMAASYDPDPQSPFGVRLPVSYDTCEIIPERWQNWLEFDPLVMIDRYVDNMKKLKSIFIDCGFLDQYHLHFGARRLHQKLLQHNISHEYQEFPDNHSGIDYRLETSLPYLLQSL